MRLAASLSVLRWSPLSGNRLGRNFTFASIVSRLPCGRVQGTHDHLQSKAVNYRHQTIPLQNLTLAAHIMLSSATSPEILVRMNGTLHLHMKERGHFRAQYSGTRRVSCKFSNASQIRLLLTAAHRHISDCFELSLMHIIMFLECGGVSTWWSTTILLKDLLSNPASTPT